MSEEVTYDFDDTFQSLVAALVVKDTEFNIRTEGLVRPDYFSNTAEAQVVSLWLRHFEKYRRVPSTTASVRQLLADAVAAKAVRAEELDDLLVKVKELVALKVTDRDFVIDKVAEFARHQALTKAILQSVNLIEKRKFDEVEKLIRRANEVGASDKIGGVDYFEEAVARQLKREDILAGRIVPDGITTGIDVLDTLLKHKGWGRKELSLFMGGAKSGKTTALVDCARAACLSGHNVLYVTLEVSAEIIAERIDANLSEFNYVDLGPAAEEVRMRVEAAKSRAGVLKIHEFPSGTLAPKALNRLVNRYGADGLNFDLVVLDYADLMQPNWRTDSPIENSKSIYVDLRAIAQEHNLAMLSATQTNREGMKQAVQKMEHVADDINKVRTCDILITINATEDEVMNKEARLYIAASRNQQGNVTIRVKQALERAKFAASVIDVT